MGGATPRVAEALTLTALRCPSLCHDLTGRLEHCGHVARYVDRRLGDQRRLLLGVTLVTSRS